MSARDRQAAAEAAFVDYVPSPTRRFETDRRAFTAGFGAGADWQAEQDIAAREFAAMATVVINELRSANQRLRAALEACLVALQMSFSYYPDRIGAAIAQARAALGQGTEG
jgi:hypothetical protein